MSTTMTRTRRTVATIAGAAALSGAAAYFVTDAGPASAASRRTVCADNVTVRMTDGSNQPIGVLYKGETFDLDHYSPSNAYAIGFAYGHEGVNGGGVHGQIIRNTITDAEGHCQAPY